MNRRTRSTLRLVAFVAAACTIAACEAVPSPAKTTPLPDGESGRTGHLSLLVEPEQGIDPIYALIDGARHSVALTMYELVDTRAALALEAAAGRGVDVRVILDASRQQARNQSAYDELTAMGVHVAWADRRFAATHEKALVVDHAVVAVMSLNLTSRYYPTTRDFAILDDAPSDVAAVEQVFAADYKHAKTATPAGAALVWSPRQSKPALLALIDAAKSTLLVENEEMACKPVTAALERASRRGVQVTVVMTRQPRWDAALSKLTAAGVRVRTYAPTAPLYIHAKAIVADAGSARQRAFVGSENFSGASLEQNRELGVLTSDPGIVARLAATIGADAVGADPWQR